MDTSIYKEKPHEKFVWFLIYININPAQFKSLLKRSSISIEYTFSILGVNSDFNAIGRNSISSVVRIRGKYISLSRFFLA